MGAAGKGGGFGDDDFSSVVRSSLGLRTERQLGRLNLQRHKGRGQGDAGRGGDKGQEGNGRRYHNVIIRCLEDKRQFSELKERHGNPADVASSGRGLPGSLPPARPGPPALTCFLDVSVEALHFPLLGRGRPHAVLPQRGGRARARPRSVLVLRRELRRLRAALRLQ